MAKKIYPNEFESFFDKPANNLSLLEHTAIQVFAAMVSNPEYKTGSMATSETVLAHMAIYKSKVLLRELLIEYYHPFIAERYGFDSATAPHPVKDINSDGSKGAAS